MTRAAGQSLATPPAESEIQAAATERVRVVFDSMTLDQFDKAIAILKRRKQT